MARIWKSKSRFKIPVWFVPLRVNVYESISFYRVSVNYYNLLLLKKYYNFLKTLDQSKNRFWLEINKSTNQEVNQESINQKVTYISPVWNGLTGRVVYVLGATMWFPLFDLPPLASVDVTLLNASFPKGSNQLLHHYNPIEIWA